MTSLNSSKIRSIWSIKSTESSKKSYPPLNSLKKDDKSQAAQMNPQCRLSQWDRVEKSKNSKKVHADWWKLKIRSTTSVGE